VDDPEFDAVFEKCAELKIPVLIHVAEPSGVFSIRGTPQRTLAGVEGISRLAAAGREVSAVRNANDGAHHLFAKHPRRISSRRISDFTETIWKRPGKNFLKVPERICGHRRGAAELGRQPYSAHDFLVKYQDAC